MTTQKNGRVYKSFILQPFRTLGIGWQAYTYTQVPTMPSKSYNPRQLVYIAVS